MLVFHALGGEFRKYLVVSPIMSKFVRINIKKKI